MLDKAQEQPRSRMVRNVEKDRMSQEEVDATFDLMTFTTDLEGPAADADFVMEAIAEKLDAKRNIFGKLDKVAPPRTVLATDPSTIVSSRIPDATERSQRVCDMHFFNPALIMKCVEVIKNPKTSDATVETAVELAHKIGKEPVSCTRRSRASPPTVS